VKISIALALFIVLVLGPVGMIDLNQRLDWPRWHNPAGQIIGGGLMAGAVAVWLYCSRLFSRIGKGTPFINEPPKHLVTSGLYSHSRNPIYVAHVAFLLGWFLGSGCVALLPYTGVIIVLLHAFIVRWEEPGLRERFGEDYVRYTQTVPRWLFLRPRSRV
jgi:protein-S-isoprenylcysteine O-methyltransferase Ste14